MYCYMFSINIIYRQLGFLARCFPRENTVLICVIDASMCACYCFFFCKLMINIEEVMYYACTLKQCIIGIISMNICHIIQNLYMVSEQVDLQKRFLQDIKARIDHQIYYSGSDYVLFLQAESVIGPGSLWIPPSFGR